MACTHAAFSRRHLLQATGAAALAGQGLGARAAAWPRKPLRLIVPYPAGGVNDVVARQLGERLAASLGQPVVVENKAGAGGTMGMDALARSPADGHSFGFAAISPLTLNPHLMRVAYDPLKDIVAVASVMYAPVYVLATTAFAGQRFEDVLARARSAPQGVSVASSGYGTLGHIMVEQLRRTSGAHLVHVPYKGGSQLITDAAGAQFELMVANPFGPIHALIQEGKLRVLAVTGPRRLARMPQTPTLGELGFAEANLTSLFGFYAPAGTPAEAVRGLHAEVNRLLATPALQDMLRQLDNLPYPQTTEAFAATIARDHQANARVVQEAQIRAE